MNNRFNVNEQEKNLIRGLHGIGIIKEQWTEIKLDEVQDEVGEGAKPDFLDLDKDGDKKESMKKAAKEVKEDNEDTEGSAELDYSDRLTRIEVKVKFTILTLQRVEEKIDEIQKTLTTLSKP